MACAPRSNHSNIFWLLKICTRCSQLWTVHESFQRFSQQQRHSLSKIKLQLIQDDSRQFMQMGYSRASKWEWWLHAVQGPNNRFEKRLLETYKLHVHDLQACMVWWQSRPCYSFSSQQKRVVSWMPPKASDANPETKEVLEDSLFFAHKYNAYKRSRMLLQNPHNHFVAHISYLFLSCPRNRMHSIRYHGNLDAKAMGSCMFPGIAQSTQCFLEPKSTESCTSWLWNCLQESCC